MPLQLIGVAVELSEEWVRDLGRAVVTWFISNGRVFPWRATQDPYRILVAEALLRQTQASRVVEPYLQFLTQFGDVAALAGADVDELRLWFAPLGLIKRADRLVEAAKIVVRDFGGRVPSELSALLSLPGVGRYSARAILCLAYEIPAPMVDESSGRVLRRVLRLSHTGPASADASLLRVAERLVPREGCRQYNLGLLDIAARCCLPRETDCVWCPLLRLCAHGQAFADAIERAQA